LVPPKNYSITLITPRGEREISAGEDEHIWDAAQHAGILLPAICHQGRCLTCAGSLEGAGDFDSSDATYYYPEDREAGFILLCTSKARSNLKIRTHQQHAMRKFRREHGLPAPYS
jgi:ferredoxin